MADPQIADPFTGGNASSPTPGSAAPKPKSTPGYDKALADARSIYSTNAVRQEEAVSSGFLLGYGPDVSGGIARGTVAVENLIKAIKGEHPEYTSEEAARAAKQAAQEAVNQYGKEHPIGAAATDILTAFGTPGVGELDAFLKLKKVPGIIRASGIGGVLGSISGYGHTQGSAKERAKGAAEGAAGGAAGGAVLHGVYRGGQYASHILGPIAKSSIQTIGGRLPLGDRTAAREAAGREMGKKTVQRVVDEAGREKLVDHPAEHAGKDVTAAEALGGKATSTLRRAAMGGATGAGARHAAGAAVGAAAGAATSELTDHGKHLGRDTGLGAAVGAGAGGALPGEFAGKVGEELGPRITARMEETGRRIADTFARIGGFDSGAIEGDFEETTKKLRGKATPLYEAWHAQKNIDSPELQAIRKTDAFKKGMAEAERIISNERGNAVEEGVAAELPLEMKDPELGVKVHTDRVTGKPVMVPRETAISHARSQGFEHSQAAATEAGPVPTAKGYDYVKRGIDSLLNKARDKVTRQLDTGDADVRALLKIRRELNAELTNPNQPWGKFAAAAYKAGGEPLEMEEAFSSAKDVMSAGMTDHDFAKRIARYTPAQMDALKAGIANYARDIARSGPAKIKQFLTENAKLKIKRVFGQHGGEAIIRDLEMERDLTASGKRLTPNPSVTTDTHGRNIQKEAAEGYHLMLGARDTLHGNVAVGLLHFMRLLSMRGEKFLETPEGKAANEEIGRLLSLSPSELDTQLDWKSQPPEARNALSKMIEKLRSISAVQAAAPATTAFRDASRQAGRTAPARLGGVVGGATAGLVNDKPPDAQSAPEIIDGVSDPFGRSDDASPGSQPPDATKVSNSEPPSEDAPAEQIESYLENVLGSPVTMGGSHVSPVEIRGAALDEGVDPDLFARVVHQESGGRTNAVSSAGAVGPGQVMPETGARMGFDVRDPEQNLHAAAKYLKQQLDRFHDPALALAAYNAGPEAVEKYHGIPPFRETMDYVSAILGNGATRAPWEFQPNGMSSEDAGFQLAHSGMPFDEIEISPSRVRVSFGHRMRRRVVYSGAMGGADGDTSSLMALAGLPDNAGGMEGPPPDNEGPTE